MVKEVCGYCDSEVNMSRMKWNYKLEAYVCHDCSSEMRERWGNSRQRKPEKEDEPETALDL